MIHHTFKELDKTDLTCIQGGKLTWGGAVGSCLAGGVLGVWGGPSGMGVGCVGHTAAYLASNW